MPKLQESTKNQEIILIQKYIENSNRRHHKLQPSPYRGTISIFHISKLPITRAQHFQHSHRSKKIFHLNFFIHKGRFRI